MSRSFTWCFYVIVQQRKLKTWWMELHILTYTYIWDTQRISCPIQTKHTEMGTKSCIIRAETLWLRTSHWLKEAILKNSCHPMIQHLKNITNVTRPLLYFSLLIEQFIIKQFILGSVCLSSKQVLHPEIILFVDFSLAFNTVIPKHLQNVLYPPLSVSVSPTPDR